MFAAHFAVLALSHVDRCLSHLIELGTTFFPHTMWLIEDFKAKYGLAKVREARDALEHEEDRIAGLNLRGKSPYDGDWFRAPEMGYDPASMKLSIIDVLGQVFWLDEVIAAALVLEMPLRELAAFTSVEEP